MENLSSIQAQLAELEKKMKELRAAEQAAKFADLRAYALKSIDEFIEKEIVGSFSIEKNDVVLKISHRKERKGKKIKLFKDAEEVGIFESGAEACRAIGLEVKADSPIRVLTRHGYKIELVEEGEIKEIQQVGEEEEGD